MMDPEWHSVLAFTSSPPPLMSSSLHVHGILYKGLAWTSAFVTAYRWPASTEDHAGPKACETRAAVWEVSPCDSTTVLPRVYERFAQKIIIGPENEMTNM